MRFLGLAGAVATIAVALQCGPLPIPGGVSFPLVFESDGSGSYRAHAPGLGLLLAPNGVRLDLNNGQKHASLGIRFEGASDSVSTRALEPINGKVNYFIGADPASWRRDVPQSGRVRYSQVYPGID